MPDTGAASRVPRDVEIARIEPGEVPAAAHVAARALHDDPFFVHLAPDERLRRRGMPIFWSASLRATVGAGETYVARRSGVVAAVASWLPPGGYPLPLTGQARQAFGALRSLALRPRALPDGVRALRSIERVHPHDPHWYLALLAVDPAEQGHGLGGALVQACLPRADTAGVPTYLETSNPRNLAWYRRFGFDVEQELRTAPRKPAIWTMGRPAPDGSGRTPGLR